MYDFYYRDNTDLRLRVTLTKYWVFYDAISTDSQVSSRYFKFCVKRFYATN